MSIVTRKKRQGGNGGTRVPERETSVSRTRRGDPAGLRTQVSRSHEWVVWEDWGRWVGVADELVMEGSWDAPMMRECGDTLNARDLYKLGIAKGVVRPWILNRRIGSLLFRVSDQ